MPLSMQTFPRFLQLPAELRLLVWESTWSPPLRLLRRSNQGKASHWHVFPANLRLSPILHACRESRAYWLRKYGHNPELYGDILNTSGYMQYDSDIFIVESVPPPEAYFTGCDLSKIKNIGWTRKHVLLDELDSCIILPSLETFSIIACPFPPRVLYQVEPRLLYMVEDNVKRKTGYKIGYITEKSTYKEKRGQVGGSETPRSCLFIPRNLLE